MNRSALDGEADDFGAVTLPALQPPATIDPSGAIISYDAPSDTLFVHLGGRGRPAISVETADEVFALADPATGEVVGFQIEGFAHRQLVAHPELGEALDATELHGITTDRVAALRQRGGASPATAGLPDAVAIKRTLIARLFDTAGLVGDAPRP